MCGHAVHGSNWRSGAVVVRSNSVQARCARMERASRLLAGTSVMHRLALVVVQMGGQRVQRRQQSVFARVVVLLNGLVLLEMSWLWLEVVVKSILKVERLGVEVVVNGRMMWRQRLERRQVVVIGRRVDGGQGLLIGERQMDGHLDGVRNADGKLDFDRIWTVDDMIDRCLRRVVADVVFVNGFDGNGGVCDLLAIRWSFDYFVNGVRNGHLQNT